ncbi:hypothetical protein [Dictyobacter aurantiacus]|uniref:Uncharacterized protein n=1 Tax=Dictyobacter aurantiacus TaxID=1936993 RepID=A0A401Z9X4_9CHLR|nr:hypothetical protein [Dictyobacter aurantiacus]GCE03680.1 hypothetical protein KDAU_10090 [Dictyobacter aurantiacus]
MHDTLSSLVERAIAGQHRPLEFYLREHSRLPGSRPNFELANDFAYLMAAASAKHRNNVLSLIYTFSSPDGMLAASDMPSEFIILCGVIAAGACAAAQSEWREQVAGMLSHYACSRSGHITEAVATAFQHLLGVDAPTTMSYLSRLAISDSFLQQRAAIASIAESRLLYGTELAEGALQLQRTVLEHILQVPLSERKCEDFRVLRRTLGYTLSVVAAALPAKGFAFMRECALWNDSDVNWILRENLKKKRLAKYSQEIAVVTELLT